MKNLAIVIIILFAVCFQSSGYAQVVDGAAIDTTVVKYFMVVKYDGTEYVGKLLKSDAREVLIETADLGQLFIPKQWF